MEIYKQVSKAGKYIPIIVVALFIIRFLFMENEFGVMEFLILFFSLSTFVVTFYLNELRYYYYWICLGILLIGVSTFIRSLTLGSAFLTLYSIYLAWKIYKEEKLTTSG